MTHPPSQFENTADMLKWYVEMGADEAINETPVDRFDVSAPRITTATPKPVTALGDVDKLVEEASMLAAGAGDLEALKAAIEGFEGCGLKRTAMNTVFSDGNPASGLMLVGEAPGAEEDRQGKPFVGAAGQLLNKMMAAIERDRESGFYISNILPWRPPGNRKPTPHEQLICLPFIRRHIELVKPKLLMLLGGVSAGALLNSTTGITRLRGTWHMVKIGDREIPALPSFHPAYLLRQPGAKKDSWKDLLAVKARMNEKST
jgi:uracil-DNA glycosylase